MNNDEQILQTINRILDLSEEKVTLLHKSYRREIAAIKNAWSDRHSQTIEDIFILIAGSSQEEKEEIRKKYLNVEE